MGKFRELLLHAKQGNVDAVEKLYKQYAKVYRKANEMPTQFRSAAWTDLNVEVYI